MRLGMSCFQNRAMKLTVKYNMTKKLECVIVPGITSETVKLRQVYSINPQMGLYFA